MNQRIKELISVLKEQRKIHSQADFANEVGIGVVQLSEMVSGKRKVSEYYINKILARFPEINKEWVVAGEGNMFNDTAFSQDSSPVLADNHSTAVNGYQNIVNSDPTIAKLIDELAAQRRLTESAQEALLTALKQNTMLISKLK